MDNSFFAARHHALRTLSTLTTDLRAMGADPRMTRLIDQAEERIRFMSEPTTHDDQGGH